ncbi:hypothetical protein DEO72_LG2g4639 [Vigna unguiculata]|uniref:LysM domain-containing protein n=1 Tax=Vigna unguiculata TaxID=3917 RepID=A0A4D6L6X4_VIGUN|nr:hypothetical protein DEO72_LG2g4639 [Vigna unguiculata]
MKSTVTSFTLVFLSLLVMLLLVVTPAVGGVTCKAVHGVEEGETCTSIFQGFNLQERDFLLLNPNINCNFIFVGQWVCVNGVAP